ncbi:hypothetical protein [Nocardioides piscis]|uniref:Uncharacterized protein n=1 Tax=Nocardioides piscis TaxID=2714938 RepID=A0A6G7YF96_9ACTN|nr:hypothetical protein [Nocardioides piscis]QIK75399.1 hypothetical protein G7071_08085 [Nocardioides piscis]
MTVFSSAEVTITVPAWLTASAAFAPTLSSGLAWASSDEISGRPRCGSSRTAQTSPVSLSTEAKVPPASCWSPRVGSDTRAVASSLADCGSMTWAVPALRSMAATTAPSWTTSSGRSPPPSAKTMASSWLIGLLIRP